MTTTTATTVPVTAFCWCDAPAAYSNPATGATAAGYVCRDHVEDGFAPLPTHAEPGAPANANGAAHLAYYAEGVSFVWSGNTADAVQVCPGGYGEPVAWLLLMSDGTPEEFALRVWRFEGMCRAWLAAYPGDGDDTRNETGWTGR